MNLNEAIGTNGNGHGIKWDFQPILDEFNALNHTSHLR